MNRAEHLLTVAMEECAELTQRLSKSKRFGINEVQPGQPDSNAWRALGEYADLLAAIEMLQAEGLLPSIGDFDQPEEYVRWLVQRKESKKAKVEKFLLYSAECGTLSEGER